MYGDDPRGDVRNRPLLRHSVCRFGFKGTNLVATYAMESPPICSTCDVAHNPYFEPNTCPSRCGHNIGCRHLALSMEDGYPLQIDGVNICFRCAQKIPMVTKEVLKFLDKCHIRMELYEIRQGTRNRRPRQTVRQGGYSFRKFADSEEVLGQLAGE